MGMKRVIVESPFRGKTPAESRRNLAYARALTHDCLVKHNEAPFLSHLLYTQDGILDDAILEERQLGIDAGLVWGEAAEMSIVGIDYDISSGMIYGIKNAIKANRPLEFRVLYEKFPQVARYRPYRISFLTNTIMQQFDISQCFHASQIEEIIKLVYGQKPDGTTFD